MAIPFYSGTLFGDLQFTGVLFGAHAVLVRATAGTLEPVREEVRA